MKSILEVANLVLIGCGFDARYQVNATHPKRRF
ncbi:hypothetical protein GGD87_000796 [Rhodobaca bogoriensis DSM 18756]|nr:hypothetical protein [Rhodobaca bogoriensis DSM 18756]